MFTALYDLSTTLVQLYCEYSTQLYDWSPETCADYCITPEYVSSSTTSTDARKQACVFMYSCTVRWYVRSALG